MMFKTGTTRIPRQGMEGKIGSSGGEFHLSISNAEYYMYYYEETRITTQQSRGTHWEAGVWGGEKPSPL